jgi:hypothetical protein
MAWNFHSGLKIRLMNDENTHNGPNTRRMAESRQNNPELTDNKKDQDELKSESFTIDLPDVKDIPGQEFIHPLPLGEIADTTISSDDEEGVGILDEDEESLTSPTSNVSAVEKKVLEAADEDMPTTDDKNVRKAELDSTDESGTPLNEGTGVGRGSDLDVSGAEEDDLNEELGEEDEENNEYSLGADKD